MKRTLVNSAVGAVATVVFSFTVLSPVLGGAVAGYLQKEDGVKVGALSGLIASLVSLPIVLAVGFLLPFLLDLLPLSLLAIPVAILVYSVLLGALGGAIGIYLSDELGRRGSRPDGEGARE